MASSQSPIVSMNGGDGETSYAKNSHVQTGVQSWVLPLVEEAIADLCRAAVPGRVGVADLGCSSGPNALALMSAAVGSLRRHHRRLGCQSRPEISVYLNDLPDNDFNLVFKAVPPTFHGNDMDTGAEESNGGSDGDAPVVLVFGAPGSFYGRLFAAQTLHLVCSSFSLHWLSKIPQELVDGVLINKGNIYAGSTSTPAVAAAYTYTKQFEQDFKVLLASRAEEIIPGGWMILSLPGRPSMDLSSQELRSEFLAEVVQDMASQGVIAAEEVDSYNVPIYTPCLDELRGVVELEGSFEVVGAESHEIVFTSDGDAAKSAAMARSFRVALESTLVHHFRVDHIGEEFESAAEARYRGPPAPVMNGVIQVVSLRRKHPCK